jgi:NADH:ubiquinone oxidoreductase subunit 2 (subunit N)
VFVLGIANGFIWTTLFAVVMALVGIYYYILVIREAFTPQDQESKELAVAPINWLVISLCGAGVVALGVLPALLHL